MSAIPYIVAGALRRIATRDDDATIEDEMIKVADEILEGVAAHERGEVKPLTYKKLSEGQFIGDKK